MKRVSLFLAVTVIAVMSISNLAYAKVDFKWGGAERARYEFWKNWKDMNSDTLDNRGFFRFKTSLWGQADFSKELSLYAKLTNEFKAYTYFGGATGSVPDKTASKKGYHFDINEVVFDNLYADIKNVNGLPLDLRLGRQDFLGTYAEGFLIMDGTPQDGSRTFYFNALKGSWRADAKNTLDFIYINDPRDEEFLPVINRTMLVNAANPALNKVPQNLNTTDEEAFVLDWKNKNIKNLLWENYYIYKYEAEEGGSGFQAKRGRINTFGSFAKYNLNTWTLRGQLADQFGAYGESDRQAIGGYTFVDKAFKDIKCSPFMSAGYIYLSGNKVGDSKVRAWDPLFSRYPWFSEFYVNSMASETGIAGYWTNISVYKADFSLKPTDKMKVTLSYNFLRANNQVAASSIFSGNGKTRGQMPQARLDYAFSKDISSYILAEYFLPGNFYVEKDAGLFLRTEVLVKF